MVPVGDATVHVVHAVHDATRWPWGGPRGEAVGYVVQGAGATYFAGDTSVFDGMGELYPGKLDLALLPVWGWGPNLRGEHMDPAQAAGCLPVIDADVAIPIHYGTFWPRGMGWVRKRVFHEPGREFAEYAADGGPVGRRTRAGGGYVDRGGAAVDRRWRRTLPRAAAGLRAPSSRAPGVDCRPTMTHITRAAPGSSRSPCGRCRPRGRPCPTAAAAIARFCGLIILPSTPPEEFAAAISTGSSPASLAVCTWRAPNSALAEVSEPVTATPIQPRIGDRIANAPPAPASQAPSEVVWPDRFIT